MHFLETPLVLPEMAKPKRPTTTITFQPDEDVAEMLDQLLSITGKIHGVRTHFINAALRRELPKILQGEAVDLDVLRKTSSDKKPPK